MHIVRSDAPEGAKLVQLFFLGCIFSLIGFGCEDPGSVGDSLVESDTEVSVDTFQVNNLGLHSINAFTGNMQYFTAGIFDDPLFGNVETTALINPALFSFDGEIEPGTEMTLRLQINQANVYGDTLSQSEYELIEIDEIWRGKAWQINNPIVLTDNAPVGSFTIADEDSVEIELDQQWVDRYLEYYNDESDDRETRFQNEFFGLAMVPQNEAKIVPITRGDSKFLLDEVDEVFETEISISQSAFSLERTNEQSLGDSESLYNTLENIIGFDLDISRETFQTVNISRAELVFFQNKEILEESIEQAGQDAQRPDGLRLQLHYFEPDEIADRLDPGSPIAEAAYDEERQVFNFNITSFVRSIIVDGVEPGHRFFVTLVSNDGVIRSNLLFNNNADEAQQPKLIITSIKSDS